MLTLCSPHLQLPQLLRDAAASGPLRGILGFRDDNMGGVDCGADSRSCIVDGASSLATSPSFVKLVAWYHNQWPYCHRLVELMLHMQLVEHGIVEDCL